MESTNQNKFSYLKYLSDIKGVYKPVAEYDENYLE